MKKVAILLPVYNEKDNIESFAKEVFEQEKNVPGWEFEVLIVVDQRSNDGTLEIAQKLSKNNPKIHTITAPEGLGTALIEGHKYSIENFHPDALAQMDADNQVQADVLPRLLQVLDQGYDLALGSRFVPGGKNKLSLSRRIFSTGMSFFCRVVMGPFNVKEFANSARAFTPQLFQKINLHRLPWREKTFIIQPSFLNEAILAGAKYQEVPLVFKNRAEGYSKNKIVNYTYDVITYAIDARLKKWGINIPFFHLTRRAKTIVKFALVGITGTLVDFIFYNIFIANFGLRPATSKGISTEIAIINNFVLNDLWTFRHRKTKTNLWQKFTTFNVVSLGGLAIGVVIVKVLHEIYGDGFIFFQGLRIPYYNLYFLATVPAVTTWNFIINHYVTWRQRHD